jgi:hypothetical protein
MKHDETLLALRKNFKQTIQDRMQHVVKRHRLTQSPQDFDHGSELGFRLDAQTQTAVRIAGLQCGDNRR